MGEPLTAEAQWLARFNAAGPSSLATFTDELRACCGAQSWIDEVVAGRPYDCVDALLAASDAATARLDSAGYAQALAAHPRIGERPVGAEGEWSRQEQAGMDSAAATMRTQIAEANRRYEDRFGHVYLVCASGLTAEQLLSVCQSRLDNDAETERTVVLGELAKIARIRLGRLMEVKQ